MAYILAELVIYILRGAKLILEEQIQALIVAYDANLTKTRMNELRVHLAFQVLYRLIGASKQIWSAHLSLAELNLVKTWSIQQLSEYLHR